MTVKLSTEKANEAMINGKLGETIGRILNQIKPEAAYFGDKDGMRTGFLVVNLDAAHKIPALAEPWFLAFDASVTITPVMIADDLAKAGADFEQAAKEYACGQ
jgi:hypothetical protein